MACPDRAGEHTAVCSRPDSETALAETLCPQAGQTATWAGPQHEAGESCPRTYEIPAALCRHAASTMLLLRELNSVRGPQVGPGS